MLVLGIDEAGRGPVIGPMMIAGVLVDEQGLESLKDLGVRDSKELSRRARERLAREIEKVAREIRIVEVTAREIDNMRKVMSLNEIEARKVSELLGKFENKPDKIIIDCPDPNPRTFLARLRNYLDLEELNVIAEHKADRNYPVVSAASIIAKVARDASVEEIAKRYGIKLGNGYPTDELAIKVIEEFFEKDGKLPPFVRKSWDTSRRIVERKSQKKLSDFNEGHNDN